MNKMPEIEAMNELFEDFVNKANEFITKQKEDKDEVQKIKSKWNRM